MATYKTVVKVNEPVLDDKGNPLDTGGNILEPYRKRTADQIPAFEEQMYYLLHWGLTYEILTDYADGGDKYHPVSYTVGICQHMKTGNIKLFYPTELTVVGKEKI